MTNPQSNKPVPQDQEWSIEELESSLRADMRANNKLFQTLFADDKAGAIAFQAGAFQAVRANPKLLRADPRSLILALGEAAADRLSVNPNRGEAYLIPYGDTVTYRTGYPGLMKIMKRATPEIETIEVEVVRDGEIFRRFGGSRPRIEHEMPIEGVDYSDLGIKAAYCCVFLRDSDRPTSAFVDLSKIFEARALSGNPKKSDEWSEVWDKHFEAMCKKTAIRRVTKLMPGADIAREVAIREDLLDAGRRPSVRQELQSLVASMQNDDRHGKKSDQLAGMVSAAQAIDRTRGKDQSA